MKDKLFLYLENQTAFFDFTKISDNFTAGRMAEIFGVKRNTVSHYLNQLVEEGKVIKINTRPVYFLHKTAFVNHNFPPDKIVYKSVEELEEGKPSFFPKRHIFSLLIGSRGSLSKAIEQLKMSANYPGGLPVLITGASGTGKSYMVRLLHQYCIENGLLEPEAPLITFNCAQYANNPELLSSNLFGHVKGAFTGADADRGGAFQAADKGLLFLDEIHRLNAEGQEKLFVYMDQGIVYPVGETRKAQQIQTRLVFATTEDAGRSFLTTFMRRIPIQIELPNLEMRSKQERQELIVFFFREEARRISRSFTVSRQVLSILKNSSFKGNVGTLKNTVKYCVARAYARRKEPLGITIYDLPAELLDRYEGHPAANIGQEQDIVINKDIEFHTALLGGASEQQWICSLYESLLQLYQKIKQGVLQVDAGLEQILLEVVGFFDRLIFEMDREHQQNLLVFMTEHVREILQYIESSYHIRFNGNSVYAISMYIYQRSTVYWEPEDIGIQQLIMEFKEFVEKNCESLYAYSCKIVDLITKKLDLEASPMDSILLTLYLSSLGIKQDTRRPKAIIIAHGYSTASSIANVANRLLKSNIFESFDMPLTISSKEIAREVTAFASRNDVSNGLIILVDMGSLGEIHRHFAGSLHVPVGIINNVSTRMALAVGDLLQSEDDLETIMEKTLAFSQTEYKVVYPDRQKERAIVTTCYTGIGTAAHIAAMLEQSIPEDLGVKILACDFDSLKKQKENSGLFMRYDVLAIIGTKNPGIGQTPYISLEALISGSGPEQLGRIFRNIAADETILKINDEIIKHFSLERVIESVTILDTGRVIKKVEEFINRYEMLSRRRVSNDKKIMLYVHVSYLIERLIRNTPVEARGGECQVELEQCQKDARKHIAEAFTVIEGDYSVKIPDSELTYIYNILFQKNEPDKGVEEF